MRRQNGQVVILAVIIIALGTAAAIFTFYSPQSLTLKANQVSSEALAQAHVALIGRAAVSTNRPGSLPCPDTDNDGLENWDGTNTFCASNIGRLPWQTLGLPDLRDGYGERLWYALSPGFRDHSGVQPLNSDSAGQLTITGINPASNVIAIIFAPGPVVGTQSRATANSNDVTQYLEGENNNGDLTFTTALVSDTFNDRLLPVTRDALFNVVTMRVAKEVQKALEQYRTANGYYPWVNEYDDGSPYVCKVNKRDGRIPLAMQPGCGSIAEWVGELPAWFGANNWNLVTHYGMDNACTLTVTGHTTAGCTVVIVTGRALGSQARPCADPANCLEDAENTNGNAVYVKPSKSPTSNDRMVVKCAAASPCAVVP
jgi:type II secretory pathway pseudopilin PulG